MEDIYAFVEALQKLAGMAWPFMDHYTKEKLIVDQFLMGMDSHELNVQAWPWPGRRRPEGSPLSWGCTRREKTVLTV